MEEAVRNTAFLRIIRYAIISMKGAAMDIAVNMIRTRSILTKSALPVADYSVNPYVGCTHGCKYCYASFMKRFTAHHEPWGSFADVKSWPEIRHPERYAGKRIFVGSVTDPYQKLEAEYGRTRKFLEEMRGSGCRLSIATKSDLILRDLDLIRTFPGARVSFSINTLDEDFRKDMDDSVPIGRKIEAMRIFHESGIRTTCFISPIFPGITDCKAIIRACRDKCNLIWLENLNLRGEYKPVILSCIREKHPELMPLYDEIYRRGNRSYWLSLNEELREFCEEEGLEYLRNDDSGSRPFSAAPAIVNYFFHEEVRRNAARADSLG